MSGRGVLTQEELMLPGESTWDWACRVYDLQKAKARALAFKWYPTNRLLYKVTVAAFMKGTLYEQQRRRDASE